VEVLTASGLMTPEGLKVFKLRKENKSGIYSFENEPAKLDPAYRAVFEKNKIAWSFFKSQAPSYQKVMTHWIMSAKQEKTRISRLEKLIDTSTQQKRMT
jgi:uncharacterized protein YdeI (YjbR/CyaY-like superfamily)